MGTDPHTEEGSLRENPFFTPVWTNNLNVVFFFSGIATCKKREMHEGVRQMRWFGHHHPPLPSSVCGGRSSGYY